MMHMTEYTRLARLSVEKEVYDSAWIRRYFTGPTIATRLSGTRHMTAPMGAARFSGMMQRYG